MAGQIGLSPDTTSYLTRSFESCAPVVRIEVLMPLASGQVVVLSEPEQTMNLLTK
jgi:hypothetical protein